jgi:hypothetical protein
VTPVLTVPHLRLSLKLNNDSEPGVGRNCLFLLVGIASTRWRIQILPPDLIPHSKTTAELFKLNSVQLCDVMLSKFSMIQKNRLEYISSNLGYV